MNVFLATGLVAGVSLPAIWRLRHWRAINRLLKALPEEEVKAVSLALLENQLRDRPQDEAWVVRCTLADVRGQHRPIPQRCFRGRHDWRYLPVPDKSLFGGPIRVERCQDCQAKRGLMDNDYLPPSWEQIP